MRTLGIPIETDLAQAIRWAPKIRVLGQALETDLAQAITVQRGELFQRVIPVTLGVRVSVLIDMEL
jgi:hypothetical protein